MCHGDWVFHFIVKLTITGTLIQNLCKSKMAVMVNMVQIMNVFAHSPGP